MSGDTTVIERKKLKLDEIVLPEIKKEDFVIRAADLYEVKLIAGALKYAELSYGPEFYEKLKKVMIQGLRVLNVEDKISKLTKIIQTDKDNLGKHLEANIPYLMLADLLQEKEAYNKLKKVMIQGFKLLQ